MPLRKIDMKRTKFESIKTSLLRRVITVPRLSEGALNNSSDFSNSNGGVVEVTLPKGTSESKLLEAKGIYNFGGLNTSAQDLSVTKIVIDGYIVFDSKKAGYDLKTIFSSLGDAGASIGGNTPPYLVNESIEIHAFVSPRPWWGGDRTTTMFVSLVPIE